MEKRYLKTDDIAGAAGKTRQWVHNLLLQGRLKGQDAIVPGLGLRPVIVITLENVLNYLINDRGMDPDSAEYKALARELHRRALRRGVRIFNPAIHDEIVQRYQTGESYMSLAREHGVTPQAVRNLLLSRNVPLRSVGDAVRLKRRQQREEANVSAD